MNFLLHYIKNTPWSTINSLGKMRFSRSSYFYLIAIPILVKATENLKSPLEVVLGNNSYLIKLELPFSWYLFYIGALSIALGSLVYQLFCPKLIKDYKNYGEFLNAGESDDYIERMVDRYVGKNSFHALHLTEKPFIEEKETIKAPPKSSDFRRATFIEEEPEEIQRVTNYKQNIKYLEKRKNLFNSLYQKVEYYNQTFILTSFSFYILGFGIFASVIIQNIIFVFEKMI